MSKMCIKYLNILMVIICNHTGNFPYGTSVMILICFLKLNLNWSIKKQKTKKITKTFGFQTLSKELVLGVREEPGLHEQSDV